MKPLLACGILLLAFFSGPAPAANGAAPPKLTTTADHSKFKELQQKFGSGPEVTRACLTCHTDAARQIHRTKHWTWEFKHPQTQQRLGKKTVINNYCISVASNEAACMTCHVGYGWKDASFDFTSQENVDCLVCHDTTGNYRKPSGLAGQVLARDTEVPPGSGTIIKGIDLTKIAQKVGKSSRDTCGACHFFGGGGDGVKHGDLDSSMAAPDRELDVHMDAAGLDFTCATCHKGSSHDVAGSRYVPTAKDSRGMHLRGSTDAGNPATCVSCHDSRPHKTDPRLNQHATKLACQTCHIPSYARGGVATKMSWDWSTAGLRDRSGNQIVRKDEKGRIIYESRKGHFTVGENVVPEYTWFNGEVTYTLLTDKIEKTDRPTPINRLGGSPTDGKSLIWPMKVFRGKQPYDPVHKTLVTPHTSGNDDTGYWKNLVWDKAIQTGMKTSGAPFSGEVDFISTEMSWPITHMVAPKEKAVGCAECHTRQGRLAGVEGVYLPGRDANRLVDGAGWSLALLSLLGVLSHAGLRVANRRERKTK
jgi:octaheme c-type cytochrome (tetrathionate reductase family)